MKLAQAVKAEAADGTEQIVYYNAGVGTGDLIDKFLGGVFGRGLRNNVKRAYAFLSLNYEPGDEIYIFGFSRGAYTARALAGVIGASGIVKKEEYEKFEVAWNFYRVPPHVRKPVKDAEVKAVAAPADTSMSKKVEDVTKKIAQSAYPEVVEYIELAAQDKLHVEAKVRCVGVWDTVGSYGIPAGIGLGALSRIFTAAATRLPRHADR